MSSTTDRLGRRRDFVYDDVGRLTSETWIPSGGGAADNIITSTYDANGNRLTIEDENGTYTMTYDELNRVETFKDMWSQTLTFTYDAVGNRTKVEDSQGGVQTSTYDAANNLTKREFDGSGLTPLRIDFTYNGNNHVDTITRYSDLSGTTVVATSDYDYDGAGRIINLHHEDSNPTNIANYTYTYDPVGNLLTETLNGTTTTYQYDATNQLTNDGINTPEYDANGNRIDGGYDVGPINQYTTDGTWDYTYDSEGNMTVKEDTVADIKWEYEYDHKNRLVSVEKIDTSTSDVLMTADYKYDPLGNRIEKAVDADGDGAGGTDTTRYSYDGYKTNNLSYVGNENWDIWADLDGDNSNALEMRYIRGDGIDQLFARHDDVGTVAWYLTDRLGSVRHMTDNSGTVQNTIAYDGFGNITSESNVSFGDRYKWTSREFDVETNLQYNRARYYDAETARWLSRDPIGFDAGDSNLYRYVHNRPTGATDPSGFEATGQVNYEKRLAKLLKNWSPANPGETPKVNINGRNPAYWKRIAGSKFPKTTAADCFKYGTGTCGAFGELFIMEAKRAGITDGGDISMAAITIYPPTRILPPDGDPRRWQAITGQMLMVGTEWEIIDRTGKKNMLMKDFPRLAQVLIENNINSRQISGVLIRELRIPDTPLNRFTVFVQTMIRALSDNKKLLNKNPTPAQNQPMPSADIFADHVVVVIKNGNNVFVFDPSYGVSSNSFEINKNNRKLGIATLINSKDIGVRNALADYQKRYIGGLAEVRYSVKTGRIAVKAKIFSGQLQYQIMPEKFILEK